MKRQQETRKRTKTRGLPSERRRSKTVSEKPYKCQETACSGVVRALACACRSWLTSLCECECVCVCSVDEREGRGLARALGTNGCLILSVA